MTTTAWLPAFAQAGQTTGFRLRGSGWTVNFGDEDLDLLVEQLRIRGSWAIAHAIDAGRRAGGCELVLGREQKTVLLRALLGMMDSRLLPEPLRRLRDYLECDVYSYYG